MPQIPTRRSMSRQSSLNEEGYDGYRTPESTSHRGASLPPTPTKAPKILSRMVNSNKPFNSLPPTPGRQLPKPNTNYRCAKNRRNSLMKRTSSVEYSDGMDNMYDNYYVRPGAASVGESYNDYYNPAYQSIDNLPSQSEETDVAAMIKPSDNTTSVNVVEYPQNTYNQQRASDLYYSVQDDSSAYQEQTYSDVSADTSGKRNKMFLGRPLASREGESMESHEDEFKDSFETALSSMSSSVYQQNRSLNSEYTEPTTHISDKIVDNRSQYKRDQESPPKITNEVPSVRNNNQGRGLSKQSPLETSYFHREKAQEEAYEQRQTEYRQEHDEANYLDREGK